MSVRVCVVRNVTPLEVEGEENDRTEEEWITRPLIIRMNSHNLLCLVFTYSQEWVILNDVPLFSNSSDIPTSSQSKSSAYRLSIVEKVDQLRQGLSIVGKARVISWGIPPLPPHWDDPHTSGQELPAMGGLWATRADYLFLFHNMAGGGNCPDFCSVCVIFLINPLYKPKFYSSLTSFTTTSCCNGRVVSNILSQRKEMDAIQETPGSPLLNFSHNLKFDNYWLTIISSVKHRWSLSGGKCDKSANFRFLLCLFQLAAVFSSYPCQLQQTCWLV